MEDKYQEALQNLYDMRSKLIDVSSKNAQWVNNIEKYDFIGEQLATLKELVEKFEKKNEVEITCILLGRGKHFIMSLGKNKFIELPDKLYGEFTLIESINNVEIYHANCNSTNMRNRLNIVLRGLDNE